jgi:hypothetical protein
MIEWNEFGPTYPVHGSEYIGIDPEGVVYVAMYAVEQGRVLSFPHYPIRPADATSCNAPVRWCELTDENVARIQGCV